MTSTQTKTETDDTHALPNRLLHTSCACAIIYLPLWTVYVALLPYICRSAALRPTTIMTGECRTEDRHRAGWDRIANGNSNDASTPLVCSFTGGFQT